MSTTPAREHRFHPEILLRDLRHAVRALARSRGYSATVLATLALCLGVTVAAWTVFDSVVLDPLPLHEPDRLVKVDNAYPGAGVERASNGVPDYYDRKRDVPALGELAIFRTRGATLLHGDVPERVSSMVATPSLFGVLEVTAHRGRLFTGEDGEAGNEEKVVLSHGLWQRLFGGGESALGRDLRLDGTPHRIVGVAPPGFRVPPYEADLWVPAAFTAEDRSDERRHSNSWQMVGRLAPGSSLAQAQAQVDALNERNLERFPELAPLLEDARFHTVVNPYQEELVRDIRPRLALLLGGALFVLLIGVVNVANLVLIRSSAKRRELATRSALGAGRGRLAGQLVLESVLLALAGGALGVLVGFWGLELLSALGADEIPRGAEIALDVQAAAVAGAAALLIGAILGLIPVFQVFREDLSTIFREEGRTGSAGRGAVLVRHGLVAAQVAFACVLLTGSGLLLASFSRLVAVDPGFAPEGVLTADVSLPEVRYPDEAARRAFAGRWLERVRALPGVEAAGLTDSIPFGGNTSSSVITVEGYTLKPGESVRSPFRRVVSPGYFEALDVELLRGRDFDSRDTADSQQVVIVDEWLAEKYWPGRDPIGGRLFMGVPELFEEGAEIEWKTVIGVVEEIRVTDLAGESVQGAYYFPYSQEPGGYMTLAAATSTGNPEAVAPALRNVLRDLDPELPLYGVEPLAASIDEALVEIRLPMVLAAVFAGLALFLAAVGIYGALAYAVVQRTREVGVRLALGSTPSEIFRLVLRQGLTILGAGLVTGLAGALGLARALEGLLYGVGAFDPGVLSAVAGLLAVVVVAASLVPARRATRVDPVVALAAD
ncbi:MAG: ABC transporter permease [Thermoanaerobaculia bacterium]